MRKLLTATLVLLSLVAIPALARIRAAGHPTGFVSFTGTVVDSVTGRPVVGAQIVNESTTALTDANGSFTIPILVSGQTMLTIRRSGYESVTVAAQPNVPLSVSLKPLPGVTVKTKAGQTVRLDFDSFVFVYAQPLANQLSATTAALCKDGTAMQVDRASMARISNVVRASGAACCTMNTLWFDLQQKDGSTSHVALTFDCLTYLCFVGGYEHDTHVMTYVSFDDISEVTFP